MVVTPRLPKHSNVNTLTLTADIHEREISNQLAIDIAFIPHVAVWFQGIHVSLAPRLQLALTIYSIP